VTVEFASSDQSTISVWSRLSPKWDCAIIATNRDGMFRDENRQFRKAVAEDHPIICTVAESRKSACVILDALG